MTRPMTRRFFSASERVLPLVARALLGVWAMPTFFALLCSAFLTAPASAQPQPSPTTLVILDFDVAPGLDPVLGRKAADALAVELKASANYEVVPRSRVEQVVANEPGLRAPFTPQTQIRLAQRTNATGVISGRVIAAQLTNRKAARVTVEARQLDATTGDVVNGAQISETTTDKLQEVDNDILLDEAINKVSFAIVRAMGNTRLPEGTVLNTTADYAAINLGARNGVAVGQRYSVMRDVQNKATGIVERVKVAEVTVTKVESDQATTSVTAGGDVGVKTGDKIRQIFVPRAAPYPVSSGGATDSTQLPPPPKAKTGVLKKGGKGLGGIFALALAVGLAGFGGGSKGSRADSSPPTNVIARPTYPSNASGALPTIQVNYGSGLPGIVGGENILGYFIYRGDSPGFNASIQNLNDFVEGRGTSVTDPTSENPDDILNQDGIQVTITSTNTGNNTGNNNGNNNGNNGGSGGLTDPTVDVSFFDPADGIPDDTGTDNGAGETEVIDFAFIRKPALPGKQYFYKVQRVTAVTTLPDDTSTDTGTDNGNTGNNNGNTGNNNGNTGNNNGNDSGTGEQRVAKLSQFSSASGGATAPIRPVITDINPTLSAFKVTIQVAPVALIKGSGVLDIDEVTVQVRVPAQGATAANPGSGNFVQQTFLFPGGLASAQAIDGSGSITIPFENGIFIPNFQSGDEILVRVGIRNSQDNPGPANGFVYATGKAPNGRGNSNATFEFSSRNVSAISRQQSRMVPEGGSGQRRVGGAAIPGSSRGGIGRLGGARRNPGGVLRPQ